MVRLWAGVAVGAIAMAAMGCSMLKKQGASDAGAEEAAPSAAAAASSVEATPALAANDSEITRYPDEKAVERAPVTTESNANMRTQAGTGGEVVVVLKRETEVDKIAERAGYYLVVADDPKDPSRKLLGWVAESAFALEPTPRHEVAPRVDASAPPPKPGPVGPAKRLDVKKNANGSCPAGYAPCSAICRASCKTAADCGDPVAHCTGGYCLGPGAQPCK